ncbi:MAG: uroporphyrinogen-III synthase [Anaerolineae bacterium]|nr:uroporphyrinogen-III synthase [Anaerolineae bacterium]
MNEAVNTEEFLAGKRIVVTRARHQAAALENLIRQFGAVPIAYPCIAIEPPLDTAAFDQCLRSLAEYDWLALSSGNAVRALADRARALAVLPSLKRIKIAALGPATAAEWRRQTGRGADFVPTAFNVEALAREIPIGQRRRILLPQSDLADEGAAAIMRSRGAEVTTLVAYRTVIGSGGADLASFIAKRQIDALSFASPSAVRFFRQLCSAPAALELPALCLGESTARAAASVGFRCVITSPTFGLRAIILAFAEYCARRE